MVLRNISALTPKRLLNFTTHSESMELILYAIEFLALTYWWRMYYENQYRLIEPQTFRKRSYVAMSIAGIACMAILIL